MSNMNEMAYPVLVRDGNGEYYDGGLTKLEWAAVQIMAGIMANQHTSRAPILVATESGATELPWYVGTAEVSVSAARALFAELEKQG